MTFKTRNQMRDSILNELALVTGSSVQVYSEPIINDYIQRCFDHLFTKRYWDHLTTTTFHTLDGAGGVVTDEISSIENLTDIKWIRKYPYEESDEIPYIKDGIFNSNLLAYTGIAFGQTHYDTKRVKFNPVTSTENIAVRARRKPDTFQDEDIIPYDSLALVHLVSANILAIDGMNPTAQDRQQAMFDDRYETLVANESNNKIVSQRNRFQSEFTVAE